MCRIRAWYMQAFAAVNELKDAILYCVLCFSSPKLESLYSYVADTVRLSEIESVEPTFAPFSS